MQEESAKTSFSTVDVLRFGRSESVLAMIVAIDGPSYRPVGAVMRIFADGTRFGTLSSGCIEADLAIHALEALHTDTAQTIRYGRGSPFMDIQLPCGGGMEIVLIPRPDKEILGQVVEMLDNREAVRLHVDLLSGGLCISAGTVEPSREAEFSILYLPEPKFIVLGKGPEAATFSALTETLGYPNVLFSPDIDTLTMAGAASDRRILLNEPHLPHELQIDQWSAILLFFHDHDWEPPILLDALKSKAFFIGAQGSRRAQQAREFELKKAGANPFEISRVRGPIGLIPSVRDPRTLAISVLAEVLKVRAIPVLVEV